MGLCTISKVYFCFPLPWWKPFVAHHDKSSTGRGRSAFFYDSQIIFFLLWRLILNVLTMEAGSEEHCLVGSVKRQWVEPLRGKTVNYVFESSVDELH